MAIGVIKTNSRDRSRLLSSSDQLSNPSRGRAALRLGQCKSLQPRVQAALVAGDGVVVQNALLHALVQRGDGLAILCLGGLHIALHQRLAQGPQTGAHTAAAGAVHFGAFFGLPGALQRRYMVCHSFSLIFALSSGEMMRSQNATQAASLAISK